MAFGKDSLIGSSSQKAIYQICKPDGQVLMSVPGDKANAEKHLRTLSSRMNLELTIRELKCL